MGDIVEDYEEQWSDNGRDVIFDEEYTKMITEKHKGLKHKGFIIPKSPKRKAKYLKRRELFEETF